MRRNLGLRKKEKEMLGASHTNTEEAGKSLRVFIWELVGSPEKTPITLKGVWPCASYQPTTLAGLAWSFVTPVLFWFVPRRVFCAG